MLTQLILVVTNVNITSATDRPAFGPVRQVSQDGFELFKAAEAFRHLGGHFIVNPQDDRVAGTLQLDDGVGHHVAGRRLDAVVHDERARIAKDYKSVPRPAVEQVVDSRLWKSGEINSLSSGQLFAIR